MEPEKVKGTLEMYQSDPIGVCTSCISGITMMLLKKEFFTIFKKISRFKNCGYISRERGC